MNKLNFGCGDRIADGWTHIDLHVGDPRVRQWNLLKGFPYPDNTFDAVYSSHALEHFTPAQALFLLREAHRVLKPAGVLRTVVPDLAGTCGEYLRILALPDGPQKARLYRWITIELLDQLVRSRPSGDMGLFYQQLRDSGDSEMAAYVRSRTDNTPWVTPVATSFLNKCRRLTPQRLAAKLTRGYLACVAGLTPKHLRDMVWAGTGIGERHRWMYDLYGLSLIHSEAGFVNCRSCAYNESSIPGFAGDFLDSNPDGTSYKGNSIYLEASKPNISGTPES